MGTCSHHTHTSFKNALVIAQFTHGDPGGLIHKSVARQRAN